MLCAWRCAGQWMDGWLKTRWRSMGSQHGAVWGHCWCHTVLSVLLLRGEELSHGMSTALRGFAGTVRHENAFPSVASGPNKLGKYKTL